MGSFTYTFIQVNDFSSMWCCWWQKRSRIYSENNFHKMTDITCRYYSSVKTICLFCFVIFLIGPPFWCVSHSIHCIKRVVVVTVLVWRWLEWLPGHQINTSSRKHHFALTNSNDTCQTGPLWEFILKVLKCIQFSLLPFHQNYQRWYDMSILVWHQFQETIFTAHLRPISH